MYAGIHAIVREVKNSFNSIKSVNSVNQVKSDNSVMLVGWLVVVARRLYLARHLFTLFDIVTIFRGKNVTKLLELCLFVTPISLLLHLKIVTMAKKNCYNPKKL